MKPLIVLRTRDEELARITAMIRGLSVGHQPLKILEAGCGRRWPIDMGGIAFLLTGIDVDGEALAARKAGAGDLDKAIVGDLRTVSYPPQEFDVIYNAFVLEHISGAEQVLHQFDEWLKPGGVMILRLPDRNTVYGFTTRFTPFWFHVLFKKYVQGNRNAGKPGFEPYPTFYDQVVSREGIHEFARQHDLIVEEEYGLNTYLDGPGIIKKLMCFYVWSVGKLSLGKLSSNYNDLCMVLRKKPG